jgi:chromosome segregation protein
MAKLHNERDELSASELQTDLETLDADIEIIGFQRDGHQAQLQQLHHQIREQRQQVKQLHDDLHHRRSESHSSKGKITSLELLQQHAMGKDNKNLNAWLVSANLDKNPRLAEFLDVAPGWETAVETVLGGYLEALCVTDARLVIPRLGSLTDEALSVFETKAQTTPGQDQEALRPALLDKVNAPWDLSGLLAGIYCAADNDAARALAVQSQPHESVITPDGTWFGVSWLKISHTKDSKVGVLQREKQLRQLKHRQEALQLEIGDFEDQLAETETALKDAEILREAIQQQDNQLGAELSLKSAEFSAYSTRWEHQQARLAHIANDLEELLREIGEHAELIAESRLLQEEAEAVLAQQEQHKHSLEASAQLLQAQQQHIGQAVNEARSQVYSIKAQIESLRAAETATTKQIDRLNNQHQQALARIAELQDKLQQTLAPLDDEKQQLEQRLADKEQLEADLKKQRLLQETIEAKITGLSEEQTRVQQNLSSQKETLDTWAHGKSFPLRLVQRAQIIRMASDGVLSQDIAQQVGTSRPTVQPGLRRSSC